MDSAVFLSLLHLKKLTVILLALIYAVSSSGMTLYVHYCCGEIDDVSVMAKAPHNEGCHNGEHIDNSSCCADETVDLKFKSDENLVASLLNHMQQVQVAVLPQPAKPIVPERKEVKSPLSKGPPERLSATSIYLANCNFRI